MKCSGSLVLLSFVLSGCVFFGLGARKDSSQGVNLGPCGTQVGDLSLEFGRLASQGNGDGPYSQASLWGAYTISGNVSNTIMVGDGNRYLYLFDYGTLRRVDVATGAISTLIGRLGQLDRINGDFSVARIAGVRAAALSGDQLYFSDTNVSGTHIRVIDLGLQTVSTVFSAGTLGTEILGLAHDGSTLYASSASTHAIYTITSGVATLLAGAVGSAGDFDGIGSIARFNSPRALQYLSTAQTNWGYPSLLIEDHSNSSVRRLNLSTNAVDTIVGGGTNTNPAGPINGDQLLLTAQRGLGVLQNAGLNYALVSSYNAIGIGEGNNFFRVDLGSPSFSTTRILGGAGSRYSGTAISDGIASSQATFFDISHPHQIGSSVYFLDDGLALRRYEIGTTRITTLFGRIRGQVAEPVDGASSVARFHRAFDYEALDDAIYFVESERLLLRRINRDTGVAETVAGSVNTPGGDDGNGMDARFRNPHSLTSDGVNRVFVLDRTGGNAYIRQFDTITGTVSTLPEPATSIPQSISGQMAYVPSHGSLFIAHETSITEYFIDSTFSFVNIAGQAGVPGDVDGSGLTARFSNISDLVFDGDRTVYVFEGFPNCAIRTLDVETHEVGTLLGGSGTCGDRVASLDETQVQMPSVSGNFLGLQFRGAYRNSCLFYYDSANLKLNAVHIPSASVEIIWSGGLGGAYFSGNTSSPGADSIGRFLGVFIDWDRGGLIFPTLIGIHSSRFQ